MKEACGIFAAVGALALLAGARAIDVDVARLRELQQARLLREEGGAAAASSACANDDGSATWGAYALDGAARALLEGKHFASSANGLMVVTVAGDEAQKNGGGTNPFGAYVSYVWNATSALPPGACEELEDLCSIDEQGNAWTVHIMLAQSDAVVFTGCTPPKMRYYGFDVDIGRRLEGYPEGVAKPGMNFGDAYNFRMVAQPDGETRPVDGASFDANFAMRIALVHAFDRRSYQAVRHAYDVASQGTLRTNLFPLRSADVRFHDWDRRWEETKPDTLLGILRLSLPEDAPAAAKYAQAYFPVRAYFDRLDRGAHPVDPLEPELRKRSSSAVDQRGRLAARLDDLRDAVSAKLWDAKGLAFQRMAAPANWSAAAPPGFFDDWDAVLDGPPAAAPSLPTRDAAYTILPWDLFEQDAPLAFVAIGVKQSRPDTVGAAYHMVMLDIYSTVTPGKLEDAAVFVDEMMDGSAEWFLGEDDPDADKLYAVIFAPRGWCRGPDGEAAPAWCAEMKGRTGRSAALFAGLGERVYSGRETGVGPDQETVLPARILAFKAAAAAAAAPA